MERRSFLAFAAGALCLPALPARSNTARSLRDVIWHVGDLPGRLAVAAYSASHESYLMVTKDGFEAWSYHLPGRRLGYRDRVEIDPTLPLLLQPYGRITQPRIETITSQRLQLCFRLQGAERTIVLEGADFAAINAAGEGIGIVCQAAQHGIAIGVFGPGLQRFVLCAPGTAKPGTTTTSPSSRPETTSVTSPLVSPSSTSVLSVSR